MKFDRQTAVVVIASTALGFLADTLVYSFGASEKGKLQLHVPKGTNAIKLLLIGAVTGFGIDYSVKKIEYHLMTDAEKKLTELTDGEKEKIRNGERKNQLPSSVQYQLLTAA